SHAHHLRSVSQDCAGWLWLPTFAGSWQVPPRPALLLPDREYLRDHQPDLRQILPGYHSWPVLPATDQPNVPARYGPCQLLLQYPAIRYVRDCPIRLEKLKV